MEPALAPMHLSAPRISEIKSFIHGIPSVLPNFGDDGTMSHVLS